MNKIASEGYIRSVEKGMSGFYLEVALDEAQAFLKNNSSRIILQFKQGKSYHRALQVRKDGYAMVTLSKHVLKDCGGLEGDLIQFTIKPDKSEFGMAFPEEFKETLAQDAKANKAFRALKPGRQRGVLHFIDSGKSIETRIKRALDMAEKIKNNDLYGQ